MSVQGASRSFKECHYGFQRSRCSVHRIHAKWCPFILATPAGTLAGYAGKLLRSKLSPRNPLHLDIMIGGSSGLLDSLDTLDTTGEFTALTAQPNLFQTVFVVHQRLPHSWLAFAEDLGCGGAGTTSWRLGGRALRTRGVCAYRWRSCRSRSSGSTTP